MSPLRAGLYACTTAADLGQTVNDAKLPELRRYASVRDWQIAGEYTDATPTGTGRRQGFDRLCADIVAGKVTVVVANSLHDLWWDLSQAARVAEPWSAAGIRMVCVRTGFDTTDELGWREFIYFAARVAEWHRGRMGERQRIGVLRAQMKTAGAPIAGRPRAVVNPLEVKAGYERGLSERETRDCILRAGGRVSKGTIGKILRDLRDSGQIDELRRQRALIERGGLPAGGRRAPRGRPLREAHGDIVAAYHRGDSRNAMVTGLRAAGFSVSKALLATALERLREAGELDENTRARVIAERRSRGARRRSA